MMEEYLKAVTCQLCSQPYTDPRILPCLHSFCLQCLLKEVERQNVKSFQIEGSQQSSRVEKEPQPCGLEDSEEESQHDDSEEESQHDDSEVEVKQDLKCPACECQVFIPKGGVSEIPQNLHLSFEAKVAQYQLKIARAHEVPCDACIGGSSAPSVGFCCQCFEFLCQPCCEYHRRNRSTHCHNVVSLAEVTREQLFPIKRPLPFCSLHGNEKLNLYCATCVCLICNECTTTDTHKDHNESIELLHKTASSQRDNIGKEVAKVQKKLQEVNTAVDVNKDVLQRVETSNETAAEAIRKTFEKLHSVLEEREKKLQSELHNLIQCKTTRLGLQNEKFEKLSQDANRYLEFASKLLQNGTDQELIAMKQLPSTQLLATFERMHSEHLVPIEHSDVKIAMETESLIRELSNFGKVIDFRPSPEESIWEPMLPAIVNTEYKLRVQARDSNGQPYPHGGIKIDVMAELRSNAIGHQLSSQGKSENHMDGTYTITLTPQITGPHQIHITMDGQHIKNSPYDLEVRKSKLDYSADLGNPELKVSVTSPLCIAVHKNSGDIFVGSEANCIYVFDKAGVQKTTIGSAGKGLCQFNRPCGLDIKRDVLYVADCNNHRIQKLDIKGAFAYAFGSPGKRVGEFNSPSAVVVDFNDRLIVADQGNCRIQILKSDGSFLVSIDQSTPPGLDMSNICGIALDIQDNIHFLTRHNGSGWINTFTPGGAFVSKYKKSFVKPTAIGIDVEGNAWVGDEDTNSLYVCYPFGKEFGILVKRLDIPKGIVLDKGALYIVNTSPGLPYYATTIGLLKYSLQHTSKPQLTRPLALRH